MAHVVILSAFCWVLYQKLWRKKVLLFLILRSFENDCWSFGESSFSCICLWHCPILYPLCYLISMPSLNLRFWRILTASRWVQSGSGPVARNLESNEVKGLRKKIEQLSCWLNHYALLSARCWWWCLWGRWQQSCVYVIHRF